MGLLADILRAAADGLEQAAGRDPVDRHADEARGILDETHDETLIPPPPVVAVWPNNADATVELTGPIPDDETVLRLGVELRTERVRREAFQRDVARLRAQLTDTGPGITHEALAQQLMAAWYGTGDDVTTTSRWEAVATTAMRAIRPRRDPGRRVVGDELQTACHGLARSLHGVDAADTDHGDRLDTWAHRDGQHLAAELGRRGLGLIRTGATS